MAWDHLSITKPHLVYIILGAFTSLFMLSSSIIKERMYIGEATVATLCGVVFGPYGANLINPLSWGSVDIVTLEFSRIVLVVQCFAVGVELPKYYMEKHWRSVIYLLVPVMTFGWLVTSLFVWWMVPTLNWLESLVVAACITATDPVLASSVVGKGKFAKRVPKHLRDLLSAESGSNDGMAFPFVYLGIYLIHDHLDAKQVTFHWIVYTILYECIFGAIFGFLVGYISRHAIKYAEEKDWIDRESFLVFYFVLSLFCAGSGSLLGMDDLLVGFAAGVGFSNDGWFSEKTEESHVSNVIDLLLNLTYFVYFGTIIPWGMYNDEAIGLSAWRLVIIAIFVILFRRIPIMMALKPIIPDIKTWREALFAGHFGPIGVGAIFVAILARAELESGDPVPLSELPPEGTPHFDLIRLVWPIVTFIVISSIIIHGSSIAVFTLGKRINTLSLTMSYTTGIEDGPTWMNRLPRISSTSRSQAKSVSDTEGDDLRMPDFPPGTLPPLGFAGQFLRRQKDEEGSSRAGSRSSSMAARRRRQKWDDGIGPGGPVSQTAIFPSRRPTGPDDREESSSSSTPDEKKTASPASQDAVDPRLASAAAGTKEDVLAIAPDDKINVFDEGGDIIIENQDGDVLAVDQNLTQSRSRDVSPGTQAQPGADDIESNAAKEMQTESADWSINAIRKRVVDVYRSELSKRKEKSKEDRKHEPARAYQFGSTIIVEDEDGEVLKTYELKRQTSAEAGSDTAVQAGPSSSAAVPRTRKKSVVTEEEDEDGDDPHVRFTIGDVGKRLTKEDFIREMQKLDDQTRKVVVDGSSASPAVKSMVQDWGRRGSVTAALKDMARRSSVTATTQGARRGSVTSAGERMSQPSQKAAQPPKLPRVLSVSSDSSERNERVGRARPETTAARAPPEMDSETPAERRRREAALGMSSPGADSDEEDTPRIPPNRRGIRFADSPERAPR